ncbi:MAG TPA: hypothetical protein VKV25_08320, partial [Acidimicrobiales bacterium]|nr:hypothetical protein [Acidimicrobiales bacterium]
LPPSVAALAASRPDPGRLVQSDLNGTVGVLRSGRVTSAAGRLAGPATLYVAAADDPLWRLRVAGRRLRPTRAFGRAMTFSVPAPGGAAVLSVDTAAGLRAAQLVEVLAWLAVVGACLADRRRRSAVEPAAREWSPAPPGRPAPTTVGMGAGAPR